MEKLVPSTKVMDLRLQAHESLRDADESKSGRLHVP